MGLALAGAGHAWGGGSVPMTPLVVLVALLLAAACVLVSRDRWTTRRLLVALLGIQAVVHAALWFEAGSRVADSRLAGLSGASPLHEHVALGGPAPTAMVLAHLVAALAAAVLLAALEGALLVVVALARRFLRAVPTAALPVLPRAAYAVPRPVALRARVLGAVGRRGPPVAPAPA